MWNDAPGLFEMMMKFFKTYENIVNAYSKPFEEACKDFLEDILLHYERCALKPSCSRCFSPHCNGKCKKKIERSIPAFNPSNHSGSVKREAELERENGTDSRIVEEYSVSKKGLWKDDGRSWSAIDRQAILATTAAYSTEVESNLGENGTNVEEVHLVDDDELQEVKLELVTPEYSSVPDQAMHVGPAEDLSQVSMDLMAQISAMDTQSTTLGNSQQFDHFPSKIVQSYGSGLKRNPTKRCRLCYRDRRARKETRYWCSACPTKPGLCIEPCFRLWHSDVSSMNQTPESDFPACEPFQQESSVDGQYQ